MDDLKIIKSISGRVHPEVKLLSPQVDGFVGVYALKSNLLACHK